MATTVITTEEKNKLYTQVLHLLGAPVRGIELQEEQMDSFLELAISEYEQYVTDWLIESQWSSLNGLNVETQSLVRAFTTRNLDYETQFTYAYSKIVGLQADGPWEIKKDYFKLIPGQQMYQLPAGREINEILWFTRAELTDSIVDPFLGGFGGLGGVGFGGVGGFAQVGASGSYFLLPAHDLLLRMQDRNIKNRMIGGELTYKITAGANGTKWVHLSNVPGGRFDFSGIKNNQFIWYWYYETEDRESCLEANKDIIRLPSDVMAETLKWSDLNSPSQNWVRKYFIGYAKEGLGRIWGKFSGELQVPGSQVKLDYQSLLTEGKDDRYKAVEELMARLERLRPDKMLERKANEAEYLNRALKMRAFPAPIQVI